MAALGPGSADDERHETRFFHGRPSNPDAQSLIAGTMGLKSAKYGRTKVKYRVPLLLSPSRGRYLLAIVNTGA